jgi:hypothetical protein
MMTELTTAQADTIAALARLFCRGADDSLFIAPEPTQPGSVMVHAVPWTFSVAPDGRVPMIYDRNAGFHTAPPGDPPQPPSR